MRLTDRLLHSAQSALELLIPAVIDAHWKPLASGPEWGCAICCRPPPGPSCSATPQLPSLASRSPPGVQEAELHCCERESLRGLLFGSGLRIDRTRATQAWGDARRRGARCADSSALTRTASMARALRRCDAPHMVGCLVARFAPPLHTQLDRPLAVRIAADLRRVLQLQLGCMRRRTRAGSSEAVPDPQSGRLLIACTEQSPSLVVSQTRLGQAQCSLGDAASAHDPRRGQI